MHSVIKNILARKNMSVPINDGRHIVLVLYGGLMTGVRGGGTMIALKELGLTNAFDAIYAVSAGFANASYLLSRNPRTGTSIYYENLSDKKFINFFRPWKMVDIDYLISVMKNSKVLGVDKILGANTRLYARVINRSNGKQEYLEAHEVGQRHYFDLMEAVTSLPIFHPGTTTINGSRYDDAGMSNGHQHAHYAHVLASKATDILIIYNNTSQKIKDKIIPDHVYEICPEHNWKLGYFETRTPILKKSAQQMGDLVKKEFGDNTPVQLDYTDELSVSTF